jgi:hypothetical protein
MYQHSSLHSVADIYLVTDNTLSLQKWAVNITIHHHMSGTLTWSFRIQKNAHLGVTNMEVSVAMT